MQYSFKNTNVCLTGKNSHFTIHDSVNLNLDQPDIRNFHTVSIYRSTVRYFTIDYLLITKTLYKFHVKGFLL